MVEAGECQQIFLSLQKMKALSLNRATAIEDRGKKRYVSPSARVIVPKFEAGFLASGNEPIVDDGQEHHWD